MADPVQKSAPPQAWLKPSLIAPMVEPVPMIVAPSVQKIRNAFMSRPPVTNFSPSWRPRLPKYPTQTTNAIHTTMPTTNQGTNFGSTV